MAAKYNAGEVVKAITDTKGFLSAAARILGCDRTTVYNYINRYPTVKQAVEDARELTKDTAELKLLQRINEGSDTAIIFYLKTQAKDRGYIERHEHSGPGGGPIPIKSVDTSPYDGD